MFLSTLEFQNFRNFENFEIMPHQKFNLIVGDNGRGKTSLLEAIYFLSMGRSFRGASYLTAIQYQKKFFRIMGNFINADAKNHRIGFEKQRENTLSQIKLDGDVLNSHTDILKILPTQIIHHENFHLLDAGPQYRREFLDWGVFYAEQKFLTVWQSFQRALKQRNALLKNMDAIQCDFWEQELTNAAVQIDQYRRLYLTLFLPVLQELLQSLNIIKQVEIDFYSGWDRDKEYLALLQRTRKRDEILGFTQYGPHRADLKIKLDQYDADHVLSRGQQKMLGFSMRIAQTLLLYQLTQQASIFLIDDLTAELDLQHIDQAMNMLLTLPSQIFITTIHKQFFDKALDNFSAEKFFL